MEEQEQNLINKLKSEDILEQINAIKLINNIFISQKCNNINDNLFKDLKEIIVILTQHLNNGNIKVNILILDLLVEAIPIIFKKYEDIALDLTIYKIMPSLVELWKITNNILHEKLQNCIILCKSNIKNCKLFYSQLLKYGAINENWKIRYKCIEYLTVLINSDNINKNEKFPLQPIIRVLINRLNDISEIVVNSSEFTLNRIVNLIGEEKFLNIINLLPINQIQLFKKHEYQCLKKERNQAQSAPCSGGKNISKTIPLLHLRKKDLYLTENNNIKLFHNENDISEETESDEDNESENLIEKTNIDDNPMNTYYNLIDDSVNKNYNKNKEINNNRKDNCINNYNDNNMNGEGENKISNNENDDEDVDDNNYEYIGLNNDKIEIQNDKNTNINIDNGYIKIKSNNNYKEVNDNYNFLKKDSINYVNNINDVINKLNGNFNTFKNDIELTCKYI
ncbi:hypothetical protein H8356DRAFT_949134 [Neocallimastix lanati (nom. inval.)]|nr:hypothetical protein H8356DRAFT_949134 [Neocallimastix sp. JGI-2020a]